MTVVLDAGNRSATAGEVQTNADAVLRANHSSPRHISALRRFRTGRAASLVSAWAG